MKQIRRDLHVSRDRFDLGRIAESIQDAADILPVNIAGCHYPHFWIG